MTENSNREVSLRELVGLPRERAFIRGRAPRDVDRAQIRAMFEGQLPREVELEVRGLVLAYREWADAARDESIALAAAQPPAAFEIPSASQRIICPLRHATFWFCCTLIVLEANRHYKAVSALYQFNSIIVATCLA